MIDKIEKFDLVVGKGINLFSMEKGSFNYKEKIDYKLKCSLVDKKNDGNNISLVYKDSRGGSYVFLVNKSDDKAQLKLIDKPEEINRYWLTFDADADEHIYGCGETYSEFDLKGQRVRIWVAEHQNGKRIGKKILKEKVFGKKPEKKLTFDRYESYYAQPTFTSSKKYFVNVYTNQFAVFDFSKKDKSTFYLQENPNIVTESAASFIELSKKLADLLGYQHRLPDWVYDGGILPIQDWVFDGQTKPGFNGSQKVLDKVKKAKDAGADVVGVWCQDWCGCRCTQFGYQVMWNWEYSNKQYPDLPETIKKLKDEGVRFLGYINPFLALEKDLYKYAHEEGYLVKNASGEDYLVTITTFPAAMIDLTNPKAYEWYKSIITRNMIGIGMGGWMADFGEYLPLDAVLFNGDAKELHNQWPAIWAKLNYEAIVETKKENEVFFFTRAGHTKTIPYSTMMWTGDQHVDFSVDDGIGSVIPAQLSLAMSGFGLSHSDVGGYTTIAHMTRSKELLLRWVEMNAFTPLFRGHEGNQPGRNIQFDYDEETLAAIAKFTKIHKKLKPYIRSLVDETVENGTPVIRPLFYHYDEEKAYTEKSQYLLGRDVLVAPVLKEGATSRQVYFPDDTWIHLFTGKRYEGGVTEVDAPIGFPPVFMRVEKYEKEGWCLQ